MYYTIICCEKKSFIIIFVVCCHLAANLATLLPIQPMKSLSTLSKFICFESAKFFFKNQLSLTLLNNVKTKWKIFEKKICLLRIIEL